MLLGQNHVLGAIQSEEFLLILILELVQIDVGLFPDCTKFEQANLIIFHVDQISVCRELDLFLFDAAVLPVSATIVFHLDAGVVFLHGRSRVNGCQAKTVSIAVFFVHTWPLLPQRVYLVEFCRAIGLHYRGDGWIHRLDDRLVGHFLLLALALCHA